METPTTPQEQAKPELTGRDRLIADMGKSTETSPVQEKTPEEKPAEAPEAKPQEPKAEEKPAEVPVEEKELTFDDEPESESPATEESSWKALIQDFGYELPQDYTEEKGYETLMQLKQAEIQREVEKAQTFSLDDYISKFPEDRQVEARIAIELLKTGQSLEQINAPFQQIKEWRAMSKEALVRLNYSRAEGMTEELLDHKMETLKESGKLDAEYQLLMVDINNHEKSITLQQQQIIKNFTDQQNQIREQKRQEDFNVTKAALNRMSAFMDIKLNDNHKANLLKDYEAFDNLMKDPVKKAEFLAWNRYGKRATELIQARALEKATAEKMKQQLNVAPAIGGGGRTQTTQTLTGRNRLIEEMRSAS